MMDKKLDITDSIILSSAPYAFSIEEWSKLRGCPHGCRWLQECKIKWVCLNPMHKASSGMMLTQRRKTIYLGCPIKPSLYLKWLWLLELLFFKWLWKYYYRYEK